MPHTEQSRLPVYLLLDCSGSMAGGPIAEVNQGTRMLCDELRKNPQAFETAWISVISFGGIARQIVPLTELHLFSPPVLNAAGATPLGEALTILNQAIDREVRARQTAEHRADYRPLVFLLTDGKPTDADWERSSELVRNRSERKVADIYAIGCGSEVERAILEKITLPANVFMLPQITPGAINQLFQWLSQSIQRASSPRGQDLTNARRMPPPPPVIDLSIPGDEVDNI